MAITAGQAILVTYQLEKNMDKMEEWATKLKAASAAAAAGWPRPRRAGAGSCIVGIQFKRGRPSEAEKLYNAKEVGQGGRGLSGPRGGRPQGRRGQGAEQRGVSATRSSKRFESATKIYERIWKEYPNSQFASKALWRAALNYKRFFEFERRSKLPDPGRQPPVRRAPAKRNDAIYNAAVILENDQAYARSAKLFLRYSNQVGKPKEAAEAYFRAGEIYGKMKDYGTMVKIFRELRQAVWSRAGPGPRAVEGMFKIAQGAEEAQRLGHGAQVLPA